MNYKTQNSIIAGKMYSIKVPEGEIYIDARYSEKQASKTIYINLNEKLREKISLAELANLLNFQGEYMENQQETNEGFSEIDDDENGKFLQEKMKSIGVFLSKEEISEIFDVELFYMKLINIIT